MVCTCPLEARVPSAAISFLFDQRGPHLQKIAYQINKKEEVKNSNIYKRKQDRLLTRKILTSPTKDIPASTSQDTIIFTKRKHIVKFVDEQKDSD